MPDELERIAMGNATHSDTLQFNWFGWTAADWNAVASMATVVGVAVAVFGGLLALRTYRNADRTAKDAHMHTLLRDLMRTQFDFELGLMSLGKDRDTAELRQRLGREAVSLKLYVLEQMWFWLSKQTRRSDEWRIARENLPAIRRRTASNDAWSATILSHVKADSAAVLDNLKRETDCYNLGFLKFLADGLEKEEPEFRRIHKDQETQDSKKEKRSPYWLRHPTTRRGKK